MTRHVFSGWHEVMSRIYKALHFPETP